MEYRPKRRILCAGMHRSGSTWLFNTLRMIHIFDNESVYSYFFSEYDSSKGENASIHVAKTHQFDDVLDVRYDYIFTTCRDLRDIAASAVRKGIITNHTNTVVKYLRHVVSEEYENWRTYSDLEVIYEDMVHDKVCTTRDIANRLDIEIDPLVVSQAVEQLPFPEKGQPYFRDTQIHYGHITNGTPGSYSETLSSRTINKIERQFSDWLIGHRYMLKQPRMKWWKF